MDEKEKQTNKHINKQTSILHWRCNEVVSFQDRRQRVYQYFWLHDEYTRQFRDVVARG